jgi:hypothetical protein
MADAIMTDATMAEHQPVLYTIFCLIIDKDDVFLVKIRPDATVYELKKEINAEKKLVASEHASNLKLFKVNIEDDDDLVEKAKQHLNTQPPPKPLRPTNKLSALFTEAPAEETVHILVQIPQTGEFLRAGVRRMTRLTNYFVACSHAFRPFSSTK